MAKETLPKYTVGNRSTVQVHKKKRRRKKDIEQKKRSTDTATVSSPHHLIPYNPTAHMYTESTAAQNKAPTGATLADALESCSCGCEGGVGDFKVFGSGILFPHSSAHILCTPKRKQKVDNLLTHKSSTAPDTAQPQPHPVSFPHTSQAPCHPQCSADKSPSHCSCYPLPWPRDATTSHQQSVEAQGNPQLSSPACYPGR
jgi:hypothetical protein